MADATVWHDIHVIAQKVAKRFGLKNNLRFEPIPASTGARRDGDCTKGSYSTQEGLIRIRVHRIKKGEDGTWKKARGSVKRSTILASLAHELAHLRLYEHGPEFRAFTLEIADYIRSLGEPVSNKLHGPSFGPSSSTVKQQKNKRK
jgi:hypothetical protein